jgi:WD40 repeat protein/type IV secretory pathway VirB10-like protein
MSLKFKDLFISYGRRESLGFVGRLHQQLKLAGYDGWFDKVNIPDGDDYAERINQGIESAHNFVYVMAPRCMTSPYCLIELEYARLLGKRIIPINQRVIFDTPKQELSEGDKQVLIGFYKFYNLPDQNIHTTQDVLNRSHTLVGRTDWLAGQEKVSDEDCQRLVDWAQPYENKWAKHDDLDYLKSFKFPVFGEPIDVLEEVLERITTVVERQKNYVHRHTQILSDALHWEKNQRATQHLLVGKKRTAAEDWLLTEFLPPQQPPCQPATLVCEFICEARKNAENMMTDIFISYDTRDKAIRNSVIQSLSRHAKTIWIHDRDIQKGAEYGRAINIGIENADNFFYFISPYSVVSKYCQLELAHALKYNKRIVPLLIAPTPESEMPEGVRGLQFVDFTDNTCQADYDNNIDDILNILRLDQEYYEQHKVFLARALKWQTENRKPSFLLRGHNLENAKTWLRLNGKREQHPPLPLHHELITASEAAKGQLGTEVFISYSRKDSDFARHLNTTLQEAGKTTWFDQESISTGVDFEKEIFKGIDSADTFLFVLSPDAVESEYCEREVNYALEQGKRFITVLQRETEPATMPTALRTINWIDFKDTPFEKSFPELVQAIELDREHAHQHTILQQRASDWEENQRSGDFLLNITACGNAETWLKTAAHKQPAPTTLQQDFIRQSRAAIKAAERVVRRRRNITLASVSAGMVFAIILSGFAFYQKAEVNLQKELALEEKEKAEFAKQDALKAKEVAEIAKQEAETERDKATNALIETERQKQLALKAQKRSEQEKNKAEEQRLLAVKAKQEAEKALEQSTQAKAIAEEQRVKAEHQKQVAEQAESFAEERSAEAEYQAEVAQMQKKEAEEQRLEANQQKQQAMSSQQQAQQAQQQSQQAQGESERQRQDAEKQKKLAQIAQKDAETQRDNAIKAEAEALSLQLGAQAVIAAELPSVGNGSFDIALLLVAQAFKIDKTVGKDTLLRVIQKNRLKTHLYGHTDAITSVAMEKNGKRLASASWDNSVRLWDVEKQAPLGKPLRGHTDYVNSVAFSPNGKLLASGSDDQTVRLWDIKAQAPLGEPLLRHTDLVTSVAFSPDGKYLASASLDSTVILWDVETQTPLGEPLREHTNGVSSVAFSHNDGKLLASASLDNTVRLWDVKTQTPLGELTGHTSFVNSVAFSPDNKYLASGSDDNTVRVWDVETKALLSDEKGEKGELKGHTSYVNSVAFSPDGKLLASASNDNTVRVWEWDVETKAYLGEPLKGHTSSVMSVAFSSDSKHLVSGSFDKIVNVWDIGNPSPIGEPLKESHTSPVRNVAFSPDGKYLASTSDDEIVRLWNVETKALSHKLEGHISIVRSVAFSQDGKYLASASDKTIKLWDVDTKTLHGELKEHSSIRSVSFSFNGKYLASAGDDQTVRLWDVEKRVLLGEPLKKHNGVILSVVFSPDNKHLASASDDQTVILWDVEKRVPLGEPLKEQAGIISGIILSVVFSPDGKYLASASDDQTVILWDVEKRVPFGEPLRHNGTVKSVAFSPNSKHLASGGEDDTVSVWDVETRSPIGEPLEGHTDRILSIAFSSDNKLATGSDDKTVLLWDIDPQSWLKKACDIANRNLSQEEWRKYVGDKPHKKTCPKLPKDTLEALKLIKEAEELAAQEGKLDAVKKFEMVKKFEKAQKLDARLVTFNIESYAQLILNNVDKNSLPINTNNDNLVVNGSFERPNLGNDWKLFTSIPGWTPSSKGEHVEVQRSIAGKAQYGKQLIELDAKKSSTIYQDIKTQIGRFYQLSFHLSPRPKTEANDNKLEIFWNGKSIGILDAGAGSNETVWKKYSCTVEAGDAKTTRLEFKDVGESNSIGTYIDNVSLVRKDVQKSEACFFMTSETKAQQSVATDLVDKGKKLTKQGKIEVAMVTYEEVQQTASEYEEVQHKDPEMEISADEWNTHCAYGLYENAALVIIDVLDKAVELDYKNRDYRKNRGLVRALTGDIQGAIEDFQFFC